MQHSKDKTWHYKGSPEDHPCLDLILADIPEGLPILADIPEGLPILGISKPPSSIPAWN
jgi:hypothetical protein